jgi:hypothetical protein
MLLLLTLSALSLFLALLNFFTIRTVQNKANLINQKVSILIPMRNEIGNATKCIASVLAQQGLTNFEVIVLDDASTDGTNEVLKNIPEIKHLTGAPLPQGWLGKVWACHQLSEAATGEVLVFMDADVRVKEHAIASSIAKMGDWDFISPYPRQLSSGFIERIFQPFLHWSWFASVPLVIAQSMKVKSMVVANGQLLIIKRPAYLTSGGHQKIKSQVLDDLELARELIASGFKGGVAQGAQISSCLMYQSAPAMFAGYRKSLWRAFGGLPGSILAAALLLSTGVASLVFAIAGSTIAGLSFALILITRLLSSIKAKESFLTLIWHPLAVLIFVGILTYSWVGKFSGKLIWRDRVIS